MSARWPLASTTAGATDGDDRAVEPARAAGDARRDAAPRGVDADADGELNARRDAPLGGQAVLEGVMMRGVANWAVAVRKPTAEQLAEGERSPRRPRSARSR